jgi:SAM-dependent methyltransferase
MNQLLNGMVRAAVESFELPDPVLEIGSYQVEGQEPIINLRSMFAGKPYVGLDLRSGPGVDHVGRIENTGLPSASFGTAVSISCFEHVEKFWLGFEEVHRLLRSDGVFLVSVPFHFHIHSFPSDYWRFTPEALDVLLDKYPFRVTGYHGTKNRPWSVWAIAFREHARIPTDHQIAAYRDRLREYAKQPVPLLRRIRHSMGKWIAGKRPLQPFLEVNRVHTEIKRAA